MRGSVPHGVPRGDGEEGPGQHPHQGEDPADHHDPGGGAGYTDGDRGRGDGNAAQAVFDLAKANGAPVALRDIGMKGDDLDRACDIALQNQYPNPRALEARALRELLQAAWEGARPA